MNRKLSTFSLSIHIVDTDRCGPRAVPAPLNVRFLCCLTAGNVMLQLDADRESALSGGKPSSVTAKTQRSGAYKDIQRLPEAAQMTRWERVWGLSVREADWNGRSDACSPSLHARFRSCSSWVNSPVTSRQSCYLLCVHYLLCAENNHLAVVCDAAKHEREIAAFSVRVAVSQNPTRRAAFASTLAGRIEALRHRIRLTSRTNQL